MQNQEVTGDIASLKNRARSSLDFLSSLLLPTMTTLNYPPILLAFWRQLVDIAFDTTTKFPQLGIGIPRGHAKTTIIKLYVLFLIFFTKKRFILVICAKEDLATNILSDVGDILDSANVRSIWGDWRSELSKDKAEKKKFVLCGRTIILAGIGTGGNFRGVNESNARPDVIIFDDAQTKKCSDSVAESTKFISWFSSDAIKARAPEGCIYIYVGNMYKELVLSRDSNGAATLRSCMLHNMMLMKQWKTFIAGAIQSDGGTLWEELHSKEQLLMDLEQDRELGNTAEWFAEVQNDPEYKEDAVFKPESIVVFNLDEHESIMGDAPHSRYIIIDPSLGKKTSDKQEVGLFEVTEDVPRFTRRWNIQKSQPELIRDVIDLCLKYNVPVVAVENYGMQGALIQWFDFWISKLGIQGIKIVEINRGRPSKNIAIQQYLKELCAGFQEVADTVLPVLVDQGTGFDAQITTNADDLLDVGTYGNLFWNNHELRATALLPLGMAANDSTLIEASVSASSGQLLRRT